MKLITCVVRPGKLDRVKEALRQVSVVNMIVAEVRDHGPHKHGVAVWRGHEYTATSSLKCEIELTVHDDDVDAVVNAIIRTARTGQDDDGYVSVMPMEHRYNISNGSREVS